MKNVTLLVYSKNLFSHLPLYLFEKKLKIIAFEHIFHLNIVYLYFIDFHN